MADLILKDASKDRYHSLAISRVWRLKKIREVSALVVGVGALGNEVCKNLAMMGVKSIHVLDRDRVEKANLTRSVFFRETDSKRNRYKTEVIAQRLRRLNPEVEVHALTGDLDDCLGLGLLREMDIVFSCLDSRAARYSLNRLCYKVGKRWVDGAMEDLVGTVSVFLPDDGACYECSLSRTDLAMISRRHTCLEIAEAHLREGRVPTTSTMGSIVAAVQVQEALKLLHGSSSRAPGGTCINLDCWSNDFYVAQFERRPECQGHQAFGNVTWLTDLTSTATAADLLARFRQDTGETGRVQLGREVALALHCGRCGTTTNLERPSRKIHADALPCPNSTCEGVERRMETTNSVIASAPYADLPLRWLGVPERDILEVQGSTETRWYELAREDDAAGLPSTGAGTGERRRRAVSAGNAGAA